ncbi:MAG: hypothetical protein PHN31_04215 [Candidatus Gracilibacteria bacterium]|nr:hypothetical protein [Candidatus Gracilibacteria bacterium]
MKVILFGKGTEYNKLKELVNNSLVDLGLNEFIEIAEDNSEELKKELDIKKEPALIIEEESIEFKDMIFEGIIPEEEEIKSMFVSIIGGAEQSCSPLKCSSGCSSCG